MIEISLSGSAGVNFCFQLILFGLGSLNSLRETRFPSNFGHRIRYLLQLTEVATESMISNIDSKAYILQNPLVECLAEPGQVSIKLIHKHPCFLVSDRHWVLRNLHALGSDQLPKLLCPILSNDFLRILVIVDSCRDGIQVDLKVKTDEVNMTHDNRRNLTDHHRPKCSTSTSLKKFFPFYGKIFMQNFMLGLQFDIAWNF